MITLNILTRISRITNLRQIYESISKNSENFNIIWWTLLDVSSITEIPTDILVFLNEKSKLRFYDSSKDDYLLWGGINKTIDEIEDGLVYILDDDNIIHPNFYPSVQNWLNNDSQTEGLIFSQKIGGIDFTGLDVRMASSENVKVQHIDTAQFCLHRNLIGENRFTKNLYTSDGVFIESLYNLNKDKFSFDTEICSYYNYFQQSQVKDYFLPKTLVVGSEHLFNLESKKYLDYEDVRIKSLFIKDETNLLESISSFSPHSIVTVGDNWDKFSKMSSLGLEFRRKWIHKESLNYDDGDTLFNCGNTAILEPFYQNNPLISAFTPIYNTGDVLLRTYESMKSQVYSNWEWVLVNDSTDGGKTLRIAESIASKDPRVKIYDFRKKSGGVVGESKYRAASLCSGIYLVELDHDDILLPNALHYVVKTFNKYPDAKFVYSDCAEIDQNHNSLTYGDNFAFGYGSYRDEEYNGRIYKAVNTQNINPKTIRHIVGVPNHLRAWDRFFYHSIGGHNRNLSIADDYELIVRSFLHTKFVRIPKMLYLQFFHNSNTQNDSRADIQRRVRVISSHYKQKIKDRFNELGKNDWAYEINPFWPTSAPSRFGEDEGFVNYIYDEIDKI